VLPPEAQALTLLLRIEAVAVSSTAAEPEARTLTLLCVKVPFNSIVPTGADILNEETRVCWQSWTEEREREE